MRWSCDRTGFPVVELDDPPLSACLWPVTKVQAERWLAEPTGPGNAWYEEVLAVHPRISWRSFTADQRELLFLTGARPAEARSFIDWLGDGFGLPDADEWRKLDLALRKERLGALTVEALQALPLHPAAGAILTTLLQQLSPTTVGELALLTGGVFEWVRDDGGGTALGGRTRPAFFRCLFNPQRDEPVRPFAERSPLFGFRPVRRGPKAAGEAGP